MMYEAIKDIDSEDVTSHLTRVAADHPLRRRYPSHFRKAVDGPGDEIRWSDPSAGGDCSLREGAERTAPSRPRRGRLPLAEEDRRRKELLAEFDADNRRIESTSGRRARQFWDATAAYLDHLDPARSERWRREDREAEEHRRNVEAVAAEARAEVDAACQSWDRAAWN